MRLRVLSLWQPHASLCVTPSKHNPEIPAKPVETRAWKTEYTGWLGIHSAMKKNPLSKYLCGEKYFKNYIDSFDKLPFGYIVGMVEIKNCLPTESLGMNSFIEQISNEDPERMKEVWAFGDFTPGRYGTIFTNFVKFTEPIRASGTQGFWYYDMPHNIGARVRTRSDGYGIILNYRSEHGPYHFLIQTDDEKRDWYMESAFTIIQPAQQKALL